MGADLGYLARLIARALDPHITRGAVRGSSFTDAIALLQNRKISGKAVLRVD